MSRDKSNKYSSLHLLLGLELAPTPEPDPQPVDKLHQGTDAESQTETEEAANLTHKVHEGHPLGSLVLE